MRLEEWRPGARIGLHNRDGLGLLVLAGAFTEGGDTLERWSWMRLPAGMAFQATVGPAGAHVWYKLAPLLHPGVSSMNDQSPGH